MVEHCASWFPIVFLNVLRMMGEWNEMLGRTPCEILPLTALDIIWCEINLGVQVRWVSIN
jgi:hypothetical protein